jgi:hypothetical protein
VGRRLADLFLRKQRAGVQVNVTMMPLAASRSFQNSSSAVDPRIILPGTSDSPVTLPAGRYYLDVVKGPVRCGRPGAPE